MRLGRFLVVAIAVFLVVAVVLHASGWIGALAGAILGAEAARRLPVGGRDRRASDL